MSKPLSSNHIAQYFKQEYAATSERYFSQDGHVQGIWRGRLAATLQLSGGVEQEAFTRLADGQDPHTGKQLIKHRDNILTRSGEAIGHRAAWDFTFGASKSVSAAAIVGGDNRIVQAHQESVQKALDRIEQYAQARLRDAAPATTGKMVFAMFLHDTSRPVDGPPDPHLHTHAVGFNMTLDGAKFRSIDPKEMFRIQSYASAIYHSEMAYRLKELGYELQQGKNFSVEIKGFTPEYLQAISSRTELIEKLKAEKGLSGAEADEILAKKYREEKQLWKPEELRAVYQKQAKEFGNDPAAILEAARGRSVRSLEHDDTRAIAQNGLTYAKHRLSERNAVFDEYELIRDSLRFGMGKIRVDDAERALESRTAHGKSEFLAVSHYRVHAPGTRYTTPELQKMERDTLAFMHEGRDRLSPIAGRSLTREGFRAQHTGKLNNAQMHVVWNAIQTNDRVFGIQGGAGTGKTHSLRTIRLYAARAGYEPRGLATTSGAAKEIADAGIKTETLQHFLLKGAKDQTTKRVYFIDESSLVDSAQLWRFTEYLRQHKPDDRVFLIGDRRQHQAVGPGRIFEELQMAGMSMHRTDKIVRQTSEELKAVVTAFSRGETTAALKMLDAQNAIVQIENRDKRYARIAKDYAAGEGIALVVSPDNESRQAINQAIREELKRSGDLGRDVVKAAVYLNRQDVTQADQRQAFTYQPGDIVRFEQRNKDLRVERKDYGTVIGTDPETNKLTVQLHRNGYSVSFDPIAKHVPMQVYVRDERLLAVGDRIQFTTPWKERNVANRDLATITKLDRDGNVVARLDGDKGRLIKFNLARMPHIDYGYATTSYSSQGKTVDRVLIQIDAGDSRVRSLVDKTLAYVAASRAREEVQLYTNDRDDLEKALQRWVLKPKALAKEQIQEYRKDLGREMGIGA